MSAVFGKPNTFLAITDNPYHYFLYSLVISRYFKASGYALSFCSLFLLAITDNPYHYSLYSLVISRYFKASGYALSFCSLFLLEN